MGRMRMEASQACTCIRIFVDYHTREYEARKKIRDGREGERGNETKD